MIHELLRGLTRRKAGKEISPSTVCIDSQYVKAIGGGGLFRGGDGEKKLRKKTTYYY
jgi:hypothetical protein